MKLLQRTLVFFFLATGLLAKGQLWKEYADSAKYYSEKKNTVKALEFYLKVNGELVKDSLWTITLATNANIVGGLYHSLRQYDKIEPYYSQSKEIIAKLLGKNHPDYATSCYNLAILYRDQSAYLKAEPLFLEAKQIREKVFGKENPAYVIVVSNLGFLYRNLGLYEKAEPFYLETKQIRGKILGLEHADYASSCNNLGVLYYWMGEFKKSELLYLEAIQIREKILGKEHNDYAGSCNNLGNLYLQLDQHEKAESFFAEAKRVREKVLGKQHPDYATTCNNLGNFYRIIGQFKKAELLYEEARQVWGESLGKKHQNYASSCFNLAVIYSNLGLYSKAESVYLEALQIVEKAMGKETPIYALGTGLLGTLYDDTYHYSKAEKFYLETLEVQERIYGNEHIDYGNSCFNLGNLYRKMNQYEKAESYLLEGKRIREKILGDEHKDYMMSLKKIANLYWNTYDIRKSYEFYLEALRVESEAVRKFFKFTSESEKQAYLKGFNNEHEFLSFLDSNNIIGASTIVYDILISKRNLILSDSKKLHQLNFWNNDTSVLNKYNEWIHAREQMAFWAVKPISERAGRDSVSDHKANELEKELSRYSTDFGKLHQEINWTIIQKNLMPDEAAVEFSAFEYYDGKRWTDSVYYIALVLRNEKTKPELIKLFEKRQLDSLLINRGASPGEKQLSLMYSNRIKEVVSGATKSLYELIWKPLEVKLEGIKTVYFAPTGSLHKISFAALPVNDTEVLSDKYKLVHLNTTASVVDLKSIRITTSDRINLYGGVQYNADSVKIKQAAAYSGKSDLVSRSVPKDLDRNTIGEFNYLPGTQKEITSISRLAKKKQYTVTTSSGVLATEESIKSLNGKNSPSILHIATHGFFFPDPQNQVKDERVGGAMVFKQSDNPLLRSGLALAGANNFWKGKPVSGVEDGILTAYEVSNMYLPNTKLAVLSACETGLGDIQGSEGVYGLQRAFKIAGVQNLVMSLWEVPDQPTAEFMTFFYRKMFTGQTIEDAFYSAQEMMKNKYRKDPYKWAAWVLIR